MTVRAVVGTNVVVSGILSPGGKPAAVLRAAGVTFQLVWTPGVVAECLRVLAYPRIAKVLAPTGRQEYARRLVAGLAAGADMVSPELLLQLSEGTLSDTKSGLFALSACGGAGGLLQESRRQAAGAAGGSAGGHRARDPGRHDERLRHRRGAPRGRGAPARLMAVPGRPEPVTVPEEAALGLGVHGIDASGHCHQSPPADLCDRRGAAPAGGRHARRSLARRTSSVSPSFRIRKLSVDGFRSRISAAPPEPVIRPRTWRSTSAR